MARILIVDDSRTSRRMLKEILGEMGHEVVDEAVNGEEGFVKYKELKPDLVTLDITMPVLDGIQALSLIKKFDPEAKAVMITAAGQKDKMMEAVKLGAAEFVAKPFVEETVLEAISKC